jgi:hypothetical protein
MASPNGRVDDRAMSDRVLSAAPNDTKGAAAQQIALNARPAGSARSKRSRRHHHTHRTETAVR